MVKGSSVQRAKIIPDMNWNARPISAEADERSGGHDQHALTATRPSTAARGAPIAIRMAISRVRWAVTNEIEP